jgi:hypothetical protein
VVRLKTGRIDRDYRGRRDQAGCVRAAEAGRLELGEGPLLSNRRSA